MRRRALEETVASFSQAETAQDELGPPHAVRSWLLWRDMAVTELAWLRRTLDDIRAGTLKFDPDEDWGWRPPDDDPGWQMNIDREKYRALLDR